MGCTFNNKPVFILRYNARIEDTAVLSNVWKQMDDYGHSLMRFETPKQIKDKIKSLIVPIKDNQTLYFGKSSDFPRFKLSESTLKRCIKLEKADIVIIKDNFSYSQSTYEYIFEDELNYYIIPTYQWQRVYCSSAAKNVWMTTPLKYIKDHNLFYGSSIQNSWSQVNITYCYNSDSIDIENIMNGVYTKIATDEDLDKFINHNLETITKEDLQSICDMLDSSDWATKGLGLKMLFGYNLNATPLTFRTIIGLRDFLCQCNEWKSVGVQQALETIKFKGFGSFPFNMYNIIQKSDKTQVYTDYDKELCKEVYIRQAKAYMAKTINQLETCDYGSTFNLGVKFEIYEKDNSN